jgi:hypothetical protein
MRIDQRNAGASVTPSNSYTLDRWLAVTSQASKYSVQQSSVAPAGFTNSTLITSLSAYSILSGDIFSLLHLVEGFNASDLGWGTASAQSATLSFRVRSSLTGTFTVAIRSSGDDAAYPATYTINAANTWETKTITIPGPTTGTFGTGNGRAFGIWFSLGLGSSFNGTANTWGAGHALTVAGSTSVVGTSGATFYITGVQLEPGTVATPFERISYSESLARCQRYFQRWNYADALGTPGATGLVANKYSATDSLVATAFLDAPMRTSPTMSSTSATGRAVITSGAGFTVTITGISAGVPNAGTNISGAITITCSNNSLAAGWGWLDNIGIISASAEL